MIQKVVINEVERMWQEQGVTSRQVGAGTHLGLHQFGRCTQQSNIKKKQVKQNEKVSLYTPRRHTGRAHVQLHSPLTSALDGNEWTSRSGRFTPRKEPRYLLNSRLGGSQGRSEPFTLEGNKPPARAGI